MKHRTAPQRSPLFRQFAATASVAAILLPAACLGGEISGGIAAETGGGLVVSLAIPAPPPVSVIITCQLPPGTDVKNAEPTPGKKNRDQGLAKWFLKTPSSGPLIVRFSTEPATASGGVACEVSYNHPDTGRMTTLNIR